MNIFPYSVAFTYYTESNDIQTIYPSDNLQKHFHLRSKCIFAPKFVWRNKDRYLLSDNFETGIAKRKLVAYLLAKENSSLHIRNWWWDRIHIQTMTIC